jgi:hypothetical protein
MCYLRGCLTYFHLNYSYYLHNIIIIYITNDPCNSIKHYRYLFADDTKIYRNVSSAFDCTLLQSDIDSIRGGMLLTASYLILTKPQSSALQGKPIQLTTITNGVINKQLVPTPSNIWEFFLL